MLAMARSRSMDTGGYLTPAEKLWNLQHSIYHPLSELEAEKLPCPDRHPPRNVLHAMAEPGITAIERVKHVADALCYTLRGGYSDTPPIIIEGEPWPQGVVLSWCFAYSVLCLEPDSLIQTRVDLLIRQASPRLAYAALVSVSDARKLTRRPDRVVTFLFGSIISHIFEHQPPPALIPTVIPRDFIARMPLVFARLMDERGLTLSKKVRAAYVLV